MTNDNDGTFVNMSYWYVSSLLFFFTPPQLREIPSLSLAADGPVLRLTSAQMSKRCQSVRSSRQGRTRVSASCRQNVPMRSAKEWSSSRIEGCQPD
ncbi:hypothetical protein NPIL_556841 [Nephila pilipes]|uniref:Uncharacterized protein n=1 Tax=Nephila pilipes TaxID=299642 RepID=A0A8X6QDA1_NEPPI|nr:hypothetical protein NPIL_556841 [Nephila pilipes]